MSISVNQGNSNSVSVTSGTVNGIKVNQGNINTVVASQGGGNSASIIIKNLTVEGATTSDIAEGLNLYFTNARAIAALTAGQSITIDANGRINSTATGGGGNSNELINGDYTVTLDDVGALDLPNNGVIRNLSSQYGPVNIASNSFVQLQWLANVQIPDPNSVSGNTNWIYVDSSGAHIETISNAYYNTWNFDTVGNFYLPTTGNIINNGHTWTFGSDGNYKIPERIILNNNSGLMPQSTFAVEFTSNVYNDLTGLYLEDNGVAVMYSNTSTYLYSSFNGANHYWQFDESGNIIFPDGNVQTTAFTGNASSLVRGDQSIYIDNSNFLQLNPYATIVGYNDITPDGTGQIDIVTGAGQAGYSEVWLRHGIGVDVNVNEGAASWTFRGDKNLTLPGNIVFADGNVQTTAFTNEAVYSNVTQIGYATPSYVNSAIANLVNGAPATLDTLNELANAIASDQAFSTTIANSLATKAKTSDLTTANVTELNNLYYTNARSYTNVVALGYATNANVALKANIADLKTANVAEVNNLYFTAQRARSAVESAQLATLNVAGNVHIFENLTVEGNINFTGNVINNTVTGNSGIYLGDVNGFGALYAGISAYTPLPSTVIQATAHANAYTQINFQNLDSGTEASAEYVITADNGTDTTNYLDMGMASSGWTGTQSNSLGDAITPNDGWTYVQGGSGGGNYVIGTTTAGKVVKVISGGPGRANLVATFNAANTDAASNITGALTVNGGIGVRGNVYANYLKGNGSTLTGLTTSIVTEGSNLYFTNARVYSNVTSLGYITSSALNGYATNAQLSSYALTTSLTTANVSELTNLYFTNARVYSNVTTIGYITSSALSGYARNTQLSSYATNAQLATYATNAQLATYATNAQLSSYVTTTSLTTANVTELTNLYFTNARSRQSISVSGAGSYDNTTGIITINATSSTYSDANTYSNVTLLGYITSSALSGYARNTQLASYATNAQLATYATNAQLATYATNAQLALYATNAQLSSYALTSSLTTANVSELTNLYFTNARVYSNVTSLGYITSSSLSGYATNAQLASYATNSQLATYATNAQLATYATNAQLSSYALTTSLTTANVSELTNLYFTNARVYSNVTSLGYITNSALSGYATNTQLGSYATNTQLATYATNAQLATYATNAQLSSYTLTTSLTTANVSELTNLYFTNARVYSNVVSLGYNTIANAALKANIVDLTTANVTELTNLYFTNARSYANVITLGYAKTANLTTANVTELTNLYFTNARATAAVINTSLSNLTVGGNVVITYAPATNTGVGIVVNAANTRGGTGYADFLAVTNTSGTATLPNKYFRLNSVGSLEIINSTYQASIFSVTDAGLISINAATTTANNTPTTNGIILNNNSYIFDDGNYHLTSKSGSIWLNANDGSSVNINTQMPSGITGGGLNVQGAVRSYASGSAATAFISGSGAVSGVALQLDSGSAGTPANMAIRDTSSTASTMYFDINTGGTAHGTFRWRDTNSFNELMSLSYTQLQINEAVSMGGSSATAYLSVHGSKSYAVSGYGYLGTGGAGTVAGSSGTVAYGIYCANRIQSGEVDVTSDERAKDIQGTIPLDKALQFVRQVDGILYTWKPGFGDDGVKSGFSAQGVHKAGFDHMIGHIPNEQVEGTIDDDGWTHPDKVQLTMGYNQAIPYHHEVIKNLLDRIEKLEQTITELKADKN